MSNYFHPTPKRCDACRNKLGDFGVDAPTVFGSWAFLCPACFCTIGRAFGATYYERDSKGFRLMGRPVAPFESAVPIVEEGGDA